MLHKIQNISDTPENEYCKNFRINQSTYNIYLIMKIYSQHKQPWNNLKARAGNCIASI